MDNKKIVWLASYPKSGNTWFRIFLTNLLRDSDSPASINELESTPIASARNIFDDIAGVPASELTADEIDLIRPDVYQKIAEDTDELIFQKIHDAYTFLPDGNPLIPDSATKAAIYFIRNPLDVSVSFAHHSCISFDSMVRSMNDRHYAFCSKTDRLHNQLRQKLLTWSEHISSWTDLPEFPVHIMRYEDMISDTLGTFSKAVKFIGLKKSKEQIEKAIKFSSFKILKEQEEQFGFKEKAPDSKTFFRKGKTGSWKEELNEQQIKAIISNHKKMMKKYGYL